MATFNLRPVVAGSPPTPAAPDTVDVTGNKVRYVGNSTPVATSWNVNDVWIDNQSPTTPVVRLWTGTAFSPARSSGVSLFNDLFTGTDGATVSTSNWTGGTTPGTGTGFGFTYLSNTGKMATGTGSGVKISRSVNITNPTDANVAFSLKFPSSAYPQNVVCFTRANSALDSQTGYSVTITPGKFFVNKWVSFTATDFNSGGYSFNYAPNVWYSVRLRTVGTAIQGRIWVTDSAEPTSWIVNTTDSTYTTAGYIGLQVLNQVGSTSTSVQIDNFVIDPT
jgi:hypothetical protein